MTMRITQVGGSEKTHITEWWKTIRIQFSRNKEAEAIRKRNNRKMNNDEQEEDQVHKYVHG
eukprot:13529860-Heterocapsa_arctica.AAC.1